MSLLRRFRAGPVLSYSGSYGLIFTMMACMISFSSQQEQLSSLQGHSFGSRIAWKELVISG